MTKNEITDNDLRHMLRKAPSAPPSPWFTRKVLNRLPDKKKRLASTIEFSVYVIGIIISSIYIIGYMKGLMSNEATNLDIAILYGLVALLISMMYLLFSPFVYQRSASRATRHQ